MSEEGEEGNLKIANPAPADSFKPLLHEGTVSGNKNLKEKIEQYRKGAAERRAARQVHQENSRKTREKIHQNLAETDIHLKRASELIQQQEALLEIVRKARK